MRPRLRLPRGADRSRTQGRPGDRTARPRRLVRWAGSMSWLTAERLRLLVPALSLAVLLGAVFVIQPRTMSYVGLNLLFNLAVPIALATIAQMLIMMVNDLDL